MTNEQLKAFLAVVEHGSFRKAAKVIYKTQAAVSASVASLEKEFDLLLFSRDEYRPKLTYAGQQFYQSAKKTMEHFSHLDTMGRQLGKGVEPAFNIVISAVFPLPPLLSNIKTISECYPHTHFTVSTEVLNGVTESIDEGRADLAFGPDFGLTTAYEKIPVSEVTFVNVAAPDYFPAHADSEISLEDANHYSQIIVRDSSRSSSKVSIHVAPNTGSWDVNDFATKKELILAGLGWGRMPQQLIERELENDLLIPVDVEGISTYSSAQLYMFRLRNRAHGPVASHFWNELKNIYSSIK